jgi:hypothetical protein
MIIRTKNSVYEVETTENEDGNQFKITKTESFNPLSVFNEVGQVRYATHMVLGVGLGAVFSGCEVTSLTPLGMWHTSVVEAIEI